jgi:DNA-directed RNA polymerase specialized sigma24 family protein/ribosome-associated translation inhibitor RaiA
MTKQTWLPWNVVARNFRPHEQLQARLRQKITKLEQHLTHFPPDAVHLQILLEKHPKRPFFTAALTLRLPSNILSAGKSAPDPVAAFDYAIKALLREISTLKADLRREVFWKRKQRRAALRELKPVRFAAAPLPPGQGPQNLSDVVSDLLATHHERLTRYVRRQVWHEETTGGLPRGAIDPPAVVDEVARRALAMPERKPDQPGYLLWFYALARHELQRRRNALRLQARQIVPLDPVRLLAKDAETAAGFDPGQTLEISGQAPEPPELEEKDLVGGASPPAPDEAAARKDLLEQVQKAASRWAKPDRDFFELYFVEGFEPHEIAMILGLAVSRAEETLAAVQAKLREELLNQSDI